MAGNPPVSGVPPNVRADAIGIGAQNGGPNPKDMLPTFIYDYLLKEREFNLAQAMLQSNLQVQTMPKTSPKDVNGVDDDSRDDLQKRLDSLPRPRVQEQLPETAFLKEWWSLFWDLWSASRGKPTPQPAMQYFQASQSSARQHSQARQMMMQQQGMMPNANMNMMNMRMPPGAIARNGGLDMRQTAIANSRPGMRPQMNLQQQPGQGQMQREGSDMDLNGQRPQSPMSGGDNEPSPKRPRTDGGPQVPGRPNMPMPNGVPVSAAMMQGGFDASMMNGAQFGGPNGKQMPVFGMGKPGMPGQVPQGSPMMGPNGEMLIGGDMMAFQSNMQRGNMQGANQQGGALADYQMQLMLLEQQNKKRLLMARQEQDVMSHASGAPGTGPGSGAGVPGGTLMGAGAGGMMTAPGMSPHGSRTGHSPNNDQMKRGTPKMSQTSPLPDGSMPNRSSPVPGFDGGMPHNMAGNPMFMAGKMGDGQMGPGGNMMRMPPNGMPGGFMGPNGTPMTPQQMEMMARNGGRIPSGGWSGGPQMQGGQMMPGGPQQPLQQIPGDNGPRSQMLPPSAPAANNGRTQPSPPQAVAPATPSQPSKPAPKKKDTKDSKKKGGQKKAAAASGAIPSSEPAGATTPTPPTPIIPVHPNSFTGSKAPGGPANAQAQSQTPAGQQPAASAAGADGAAAAGPFGNIDPTNDMGMGAFDFQNTDNADVLDGFDFDSFLHMDDSMPFNDFDPSQYALNGDGVEMGAADP